jgi:Glycosyltransferase
MHIFGSFGPGGAEMGVVQLIKSFPDKDVKHSVCSIGSDVSMKELLPEGTNLYSLNIDGASYSAFMPMFRLLKKTNTDIAHVNNLASWFDVALASTLANCKCIETFHGVEEDLIKFPIYRRLLVKTASLLTRQVTAVAESAADWLIKLTGIKRHNIRVIPNAVDTDFFKPCPSIVIKRKLRIDLGLPEACLLMGCVAGLRPVKNHEGLLRAFARIVSGKRSTTPNNDICLAIIGEGSLMSELQRLSKRLSIEDKVIFMGRRNDVHKILQALDLFVLNSKTEGMSYAVLEAMASGLPIIVTDVGANAELVNHGKEGYLIPREDSESLVRCIVQVNNNRFQLSDMGKNSRKKIIKSYSLSKMVSSYKDLYEELHR